MLKLPRYQIIEGLIVCEGFSADAVRSSFTYKPRDDDIFVVTFPKCGTTWTQNILFLIFNKGKPFENSLEFMIKTPYLELCGAESAEKMPRPGAIKIHLPFHMTPYSPSAKYIYVARNPKDTCVSLYHHTKLIALYKFDGSFDDYFEIFYNGQNEYNDYFAHILSWYEHRNDPNVLFLTYEELKLETRRTVLKMAKFLGEEYERMLIDHPEIMEDVLKYSSVEEMKKIASFDQTETAPPLEALSSGLRHIIKLQEEIGVPPVSNFDLIRKGIIGDWKNHFSEEKAKKLDEKTRDKLAGTDLLKFWQSLGILA